MDREIEGLLDTIRRGLHEARPVMPSQGSTLIAADEALAKLRALLSRAGEPVAEVTSTLATAILPSGEVIYEEAAIKPGLPIGTKLYTAPPADARDAAMKESKA